MSNKRYFKKLNKRLEKIVNPVVKEIIILGQEIPHENLVLGIDNAKVNQPSILRYKIEVYL